MNSRNDTQFRKIVDESDDRRQQLSGLSLRDLPLFGAGEEPTVYYSLMFSELRATYEEKDNWFPDRLNALSMVASGHNLSRLAYQTVGMNVQNCWTPQVEAMLCVYQVGPWFDLLLRWQLDIARKLTGTPILSVRKLVEIQTELGSDIFPRGELIPDLDASVELWEKQKLSDGFPGLLVSRFWPFDIADKPPMIFQLQGGAVVEKYFQAI